MVRRYKEQQTAANDVMISAHPIMVYTPLLAQFQFSTSHIGPPLKTRLAYWIYSTSTSREIPARLNQMFGVGEQGRSTPIQLPVPAKANMPDNGDIHLLVIDDNPINRQLPSDQISSLDYQVVTTNDGVDVLGGLNHHSIDIVLTDVNMPNMDGYRLTQLLRQLNVTLPVIGVTENALAEEKQRCIEAGMDNCPSKPMPLEMLEQTLAYYS